MSVYLDQLLAGFSDDFIPKNILVAGVATDSRQINSGDCFFALAGMQFDGRHYIAQAIAQGAAAVVYERKESSSFQLPDKVPCISISDLGQKIGDIASRFYHDPTKKMCVVGVTGTNGKTSTSIFLSQALTAMNSPSAVIGTLGMRMPGHVWQTTNFTTPDALTLQKFFSACLTEQIKHAVMEVSSHSLVQGRVNGVAFDTAIFTNLTHEHLDYHGDMKAYGEAKTLLFERPGLSKAVINVDDPFGRALIDRYKHRLTLCWYSLNGNLFSKEIPFIYVKSYDCNANGIQADIDSSWGAGRLNLSLLGLFNLSNVLATMGALCLLGFPFQAVLAVCSQFSPVPGRMELFGGGKEKPLVVVDYAHTPDALEKALMACRDHMKSTELALWCVFGCGGDRDSAKRAPMGRIAQQYSDHVVLTQDNPRHEDSKHIETQILSGMKDLAKIVIEPDRKKAIQFAITHARPGDWVLVAGKGHEDYQIIGDQRLAFSDRECVKRFLDMS